MSGAPFDPALSTRAMSILIAAAEAGGRAAAAFFRPGERTSARIRYKASNSPVTEADHAADAAIRDHLAHHLADVAIFSEEAAHGDARFSAPLVAVVDPIDGTRAFISGRDEWCVSIALLKDNRPIAGVVHGPARGETYAAGLGGGAFLNGRPLPVRYLPSAPLRVTGPTRLIDQLVDYWPAMRDGETLKALAYRLVTVAGGRHDIALATHGAHDWDIAAADIILGETGCALTTLTGARPVYNAVNPVHPALVAAPAVLAGRLVADLAIAPA